MVDNRSLLTRFTSVAGQVGSVISRVDLDALDRQQMKLVGTIKHLMADTRLDIRDWEMADSREEMLKHGQEALKRLEQVRETILLASQHGIFTPIEVAEVSAQFDLFTAELKR